MVSRSHHLARGHRHFPQPFSPCPQRKRSKGLGTGPSRWRLPTQQLVPQPFQTLPLQSSYQESWKEEAGRGWEAAFLGQPSFSHFIHGSLSGGPWRKNLKEPRKTAAAMPVSIKVAVSPPLSGSSIPDPFQRSMKEELERTRKTAVVSQWSFPSLVQSLPLQNTCKGSIRKECERAGETAAMMLVFPRVVRMAFWAPAPLWVEGKGQKCTLLPLLTASAASEPVLMGRPSTRQPMRRGSKAPAASGVGGVGGFAHSPPYLMPQAPRPTFQMDLSLTTGKGRPIWF